MICVAVLGQGRCGLGALGLRAHFHVGLDTMIAQRQGMKWENKSLQIAAPGRQMGRVSNSSKEVGREASWALEAKKAFLLFPPLVL